MFWKWMFYDIDLSKTRNKILTIFSIFVVATIAWIFLLPVISPCGTWICRNAKNQNTDFVVIHENRLTGYTVIVLSNEMNNISAENKNNIMTAWMWRIQTLRNYSYVEETKSYDLKLDG